MINKWNLKTPGREDEETALPAEAVSAAHGDAKYAAMARTILRGLGGPGNLASVDNCITRLRLEVKDPAKVDDGVIRSSGAVRSGFRIVGIKLSSSSRWYSTQ